MITLLGLAIASTSFAQTSTVTLYIPGADVQPLVASIVASDATATTYAVQCKPGTDSSDCGFSDVFTLTEGSAKAQYTIAPQKDENGTVAFEGYFDCSLAGTTSAVCAESFGGTEANFPGMSTETISGTDLVYQQVIVTARAAANSGASSSSVGPSTTNTGSTTANTSGASAKTSGSGASSSGATQTSSSQAAASSKAGVAAVTGNTKWALGGAAVALAIMA